MKNTAKFIACLAVLATLSGCGTEETTVVHERTVVQPVPVRGYVYDDMTIDAVEANCAHGYDIKTHSCY